MAAGRSGIWLLLDVSFLVLCLVQSEAKGASLPGWLVPARRLKRWCLPCGPKLKISNLSLLLTDLQRGGGQKSVSRDVLGGTRGAIDLWENKPERCSAWGLLSVWSCWRLGPDPKGDVSLFPMSVECYSVQNAQSTSSAGGCLSCNSLKVGVNSRGCPWEGPFHPFSLELPG